MDDEEQDALDIQENGEADADIPEEQAVEQQIVPFLGDDLAAAMTAAGLIYITLPGMCKTLGLNINGQTQRIKRTRVLAKGLRRIALTTRGGFQRANCLRVDQVALSGTRPLQRGRLALESKPHLDQSQPLASLRRMGLRSGRNQIRPGASPAWTTMVQD